MRFVSRFFEFLKLDGDDTKSNASTFAKRVKLDPKWATSAIMSFIQYQKQRVKKNKITDILIGNYYKPVKIFCVMHDMCVYSLNNVQIFAFNMGKVTAIVGAIAILIIVGFIAYLYVSYNAQIEYNKAIMETEQREYVERYDPPQTTHSSTPQSQMEQREYAERHDPSTCIPIYDSCKQAKQWADLISRGANVSGYGP